MATLRNSIHIDVPPERVWVVLGCLEALQLYDPAIEKVVVVSAPRDGLGATRKCDLRGGGWFCERVTIWAPPTELEFELYDCTLPVRRLRHHYRLVPDGGGTRVDQCQEYELKFGVIGVLLDILVVRRKWDAGIKSFFAGLKTYVEKGLDT